MEKLDKIETLASLMWSFLISMYTVAEIWRTIEVNICGEVIPNKRDTVIYIIIGIVIFSLLWKHKTVRNSYILDLILLAALVISNAFALMNECAIVEFTMLDILSLCSFPAIEYAVAARARRKQDDTDQI